MTRNLNQNQGPFEDIFQSLQASLQDVSARHASFIERHEDLYERGGENSYDLYLDAIDTVRDKVSEKCTNRMPDSSTSQQREVVRDMADSRVAECAAGYDDIALLILVNNENLDQVRRTLQECVDLDLDRPAGA